jgi:hypothetical protein
MLLSAQSLQADLALKCSRRHRLCRSPLSTTPQGQVPVVWAVPIVPIVTIAGVLRDVTVSPIVPWGERIGRTRAVLTFGGHRRSVCDAPCFSAECDTVCGDLRDRHAEEPPGFSDRRETGSRVEAASLPCRQRTKGGRQVPRLLLQEPCKAPLPGSLRTTSVAVSSRQCARSSPFTGAHCHVCDLAKSASR